MIKTPASYNLLMGVDCVNTIRSPRMIPPHGNYLQRPLKTKVSIYRNVSPAMKKRRFFETMEPKTNAPERVVNFDSNQLEQRIKNGNLCQEQDQNIRSTVGPEKPKFEETITRNKQTTSFKRSISHQITRHNSRSKNTRRNKFEEKMVKKEFPERAISPMADRVRIKRPVFTSLSPEVKRRFGSVTVGKVVGKREIGRSQSKSSTIISKQSTLVKTPLRK